MEEEIQKIRQFKNIDMAIKIYKEFRKFKNDGFIESIDPDFFFNLTDYILANSIPISFIEKEIEELSEELEIMKVDNMHSRYKEYGGKKKWEEMFQYKYGKHDVLQSLLGKE